MKKLLNKKEIELGLKKIPGWKLKNKKISRIFVFEDFLTAMEFVNSVADLSEKAQHHPDIKISYNKVSITLWTHDLDGLSEKDFSLASKISNL